MELWEIVARESIRDLVVRYNSNADTGRFKEVIELFAPDGVMVFDDGSTSGSEQILKIFTDVNEKLATSYVRHMTATHQIDLIDRRTASGRCYYQVLTAIGLDHWGRYIDDYGVIDGRWKFVKRRVSVDGRSPASLFGPA